MANWPSFDQRIETGRFMIKTGRFTRKRRPASCNSPCFDQKIETEPVCCVQLILFPSKTRNWASWRSVRTSSLQNRPSPLDSSRKLTNSSLRQQGTLLNVPGRKSLPKCSKILFCKSKVAFWPLFPSTANNFWDWFYIGNRLQETQPNQVLRKHPN